MALQTIISTLLGVGVGPLLVGLFSDLLLPVYGQESLRYALMLGACRCWARCCCWYARQAMRPGLSTVMR
jgi:ACR3 family arsenite efflux pump ArsB